MSPSASESVDTADLRIPVAATVSGRVFDDNKEPVPDVRLVLVDREYFLGSLGYFSSYGAVANDLGEYTINNIPSGRGFLLLVESNPNYQMPSLAETPLKPELRRPVIAQSYYPKSPQADSALVLTLKSGEHREAIDLQIIKAPSYCISGVIAGAGSPGPYVFQMTPMLPAGGLRNNGGSYGSEPGGRTTADGRFRACGLYPGAWRFTAHDDSLFDGKPGGFRVMTLQIGDRDLDNLKVTLSAAVPVAGQVEWDAAANLDAVPNGVNLILQPIRRTQFSSETLSNRTDIPGAFTLSAIYPDAYQVRAMGLARGSYLKDVTLGGRSILNQPFDAASAAEGLRLIVAADGAHATVNVTGKNSRPVSDISVFLIPADETQEPAIAANLLAGRTNQRGTWTAATVRPGKYLAVASHDRWDYTPEVLARILALRSHGKEVVLTPKSSLTVTLELPDE